MRWDQPIPKSEHVVPAIAHSALMGAWFGACCAAVWGFGFDTTGSPYHPIAEVTFNVLVCAGFGGTYGAWTGLAASPALAFAYMTGMNGRDRHRLVMLTTVVSVASSFVPIPVEPIYRCIGVSVTVYVALCLLFGFRAWGKRRNLARE